LSEEQQRIEELEDAICDILDVVVGYTRSMTDGEKFRVIRSVGEKALKINAA